MLYSDHAGPVPSDNLPFPSVPAGQEPHSQTHDSGVALSCTPLCSPTRLQALLPVRQPLHLLYEQCLSTPKVFKYKL